MSLESCISLIQKALGNLDSVKQAVVIEVTYGCGKALAAYIQFEAGVEMDTAQLQERLKAHSAETLPDYMIPASFSQIEQVPLTANGKLDKSALPNPQWTDCKDYVEPRNLLEMDLCDIWQQVLKVEIVGINDNIFELGIHWLNAIQLTIEIEQTLGLSIRLKDLYQHTNVGELAAFIEQYHLSEPAFTHQVSFCSDKGQDFNPLLH